MENENIRVIHVITTIERGGAENAVLALAREQVKNGYQVVVVPLKGELELEREFIEAGVTLDLLLHSRQFAEQVMMFRRQYNEDFLFHGHLPRSELLLRFSKSKSCFFVTRHNAEAFFPKSPRLISRILSRFVTNKSESVIAISKAVLHFLLETKEISTRTSSLVIHYGYLPRCMTTAVKKLYSPSNGGTLRIGTISRLTPQKHLVLLIRLGEILRDLKVKFLIQIVGVGPEKSLLETKVSEIGLENEILFLGKKTDIMPFLQDQDVFVLTSNYEGFGLVLLEAMDAKLPIIAARNSAIPEVLGESHPGLFVTRDSESLLQTLLDVLQFSDTYTEIMNTQSVRLDYFSMAKYFYAHHQLYTQSKMKV